MLSNSALVIAKLVVGILSGSVSVLAEALHSGVDLGAAFIALFAVRKAAQPPDTDHQYGHGKYESLSALAEAILILIAAGVIVVVAIRKLLAGHALDHTWLGIVVMGVSAAVNLVVSAYLFRVGRAHRSIAIEADAWHLRTDVYTSVAVFGGLLLVVITEKVLFDSLLAIVVALIIVRAGVRLSHRAVSQLLDRSLPPAELAQVVAVIEEHAGDYVGFHDVRSRRAGGERHIDLHLVVREDASVADAHGVADHLEKEIAQRLPGTKVLIHIDPSSEDAESRSEEEPR